MDRFSSYQEFIRDFYVQKKAARQGFSFRLFSKKAGFRSPNFIQLVIQGKRNLTPTSAIKVAKAMGLNPAEATYFRALVATDTARTPQEKAQAHRSALVAAKNLLTKMIPKAQEEVLSHWYHLVIRELVFLEDFLPQGEWISKKLRGLVSAAEADRSLGLLLQSGFIKADKRGRLHAVDPIVDTGNSFHAIRILNSHLETLATWRRLLEIVGPEDRELGLLNLPISSEKIPEFKKRIRDFQDEIIGWLQSEKNPNQIVQLGTYLVPLTGTHSNGI